MNFLESVNRNIGAQSRNRQRIGHLTHSDNDTDMRPSGIPRDADPDIPILKQAKGEYAKLN